MLVTLLVMACIFRMILTLFYMDIEIIPTFRLNIFELARCFIPKN